MSRKAIIPLNRIPAFCPNADCGYPVPVQERERQTHPFHCANPKGAHLIFVSPNPTAFCFLFVRLPGSRLGVVLARRGLRDEPGFGKWAAPGGFTEAETGTEAARSEFQEELGVDISRVALAHANEYYDPSYHCWNHFYAGLWPDQEPPQLQVTQESLEVMICPVDELPELAFRYQREFILEAATRFVV